MKMLFTFLLIIYCLFQINTKHLSNYKFLLYQTKEDSFSLDDQEFNFILLPSQANARMLFKAKFPIKTFFEIDSLSPFIFVPEIFCLYCLKKDQVKIKTMKGNIYRGQFEDISEAQIFLTNIVIEITSVIYMEFLPKERVEENKYIVLSNIIHSDTKGNSILVMKKNSEIKPEEEFFQVAKLYFSFGSGLPEKFDFEVSEEIQILNGEEPLNNGGEYSTTKTGDEIVKVIFNEVKSVYCEFTKSSSGRKSCF